mgnify:CR=1 FL=1
MSHLTLNSPEIVAGNSLIPQTPFTRKLLTSGYLNCEEIEAVNREIYQSSQSLPERVMAIRGQPLPAELWEFYQQQKRFELKLLYGVEVFDPRFHCLEMREFSNLMKTLELSGETCRRHGFIPLKLESESPQPILLIAQIDPDELEITNQVLTASEYSRAPQIRQWAIIPEDHAQILAEYEAQF